MTIMNRDGARHIRDGGDLLELFKAAADRGVMLRSEVSGAIVEPILSWARKAIAERLMVTKVSGNGRKEKG
jgi:hypothetical protein